MRRSLVFALAAALLVADLATAHSLLLESSPPAEAVVAASPSKVSLRFNNRIEKALSHIRLVDPRGARHELTVAATDGTPDLVIAPLPPLDTGQYRVEWRVLSTDGHIVSGRFSFRVGR